jgi:predicted acetyltransferase
MSVEIRAITEDEIDAYATACQTAFGDEPRDGEEDRLRQGLGLDRTRAAFDDGRIVGTLGSYGFQMAVPGGVDVATSGLTRVTVAATHRRQGILTRMMDAHFEDAAAHDEALSILWASEVAIYGRFGYGQANELTTIEYDTRLAGIRPPDDPDSLAIIDEAEAGELFPPIRERSRIERPGMYQRPDHFWPLRVLPDPEWARDGGSPRRYVVARRNGEPVGYAMYRHHRKWNDLDLPDGKISVVELSAIDRRAEHNLWWFLSNIDLFPTVTAWSQPTDTIVPWLARNPRAIRRLVNDGIHLRVLDVATALSARRYDQPGDVVFSLTDGQRPAQTGTYRLTVADDGQAVCQPTDDEPTAQISPYGLGTLYLGWAPVPGLVGGGHLTADAESQAAIGRLFAWPVAPLCDEGF